MSRYWYDDLYPASAEVAVAPPSEAPSAPPPPEVSENAYVYALGRIEPRFPSPSIERELAQAAGRTMTAGLTDSEVLHKVLGDRSNRYLLRQVTWVLTIEGLETYILMPRDPMDFDLLAEALRTRPGGDDVDVVIGIRGPLAPPEMANGLALPVVIFDQVYSFDVDSLIAQIPRPAGMDPERFEPAAEEVFRRIAQVADNGGTTDAHRALNYLAVRYPHIYAQAAQAYAREEALTAVRVKESRLAGARKVVDVIFSFTTRSTDVTGSYFVRVDVTEQFPFLVTRLTPYYER